MNNLQALENQEMRLHRIRTKVVAFKELVQVVYQNEVMTYDQFLELNLAAQVSSDYNDALTLNKLTCIFPTIGAFN
jgi:peptide methionine sulfoxide reductase MsrA